MTALEIIKALKATRNDSSPALLWINHTHKAAAFHLGGAESYCTVVSYNDAIVARGDTSLTLVSRVDGETWTA